MVIIDTHTCVGFFLFPVMPSALEDIHVHLYTLAIQCIYTRAVICFLYKHLSPVVYIGVLYMCIFYNRKVPACGRCAMMVICKYINKSHLYHVCIHFGIFRFKLMIAYARYLIFPAIFIAVQARHKSSKTGAWRPARFEGIQHTSGEIVDCECSRCHNKV